MPFCLSCGNVILTKVPLITLSVYNYDLTDCRVYDCPLLRLGLLLPFGEAIPIIFVYGMFCQGRQCETLRPIGYICAFL